MRQLTQRQLDGALSLIDSYQNKLNDGASHQEAMEAYAETLMASPDLSSVPEFRAPLATRKRIQQILNGFSLDGLEIKRDSLFGVSFSRCSMRRMELSLVSFEECNFYSADLEGSNLSGSHLLECPMSMASLKRCDLSDMVIDNHDGFMNHIDFTMANLEATRLTGLDLRQADFHMANLDRAVFDSCELFLCNMATAYCVNATFDNCKEIGAIR
ncbi:pentapeptide repeat-containing protein [Aeromonas hydrophila]|uniref:pentapeptide repeat-containing protein n=1 Tax=Aeromonas hydrophila TaxID=644 RepID=UPI003D23BAB2